MSSLQMSLFRNQRLPRREEGLSQIYKPGSDVSGPFTHTHKALYIKGTARYVDIFYSYRCRSYFAYIITYRFVSLDDTLNTF